METDLGSQKGVESMDLERLISCRDLHLLSFKFWIVTFTLLGWKMNGDCKTKLAAGTVVEIEARASLFTDPISDFDEEVLHSFNCVLEIDTLGERRRVICEKTCTDRVVLWKVICENVVKIRG
ncbi:hypothetical protein TNCV_985531 [Trichonephila clavipes]|nr:hypothetical protein TNCV_985531 [Trichonephila clavipes]